MTQLPKGMHHCLTKLLAKNHIGFRIGTLKHNNLLLLFYFTFSIIHLYLMTLDEFQDWNDLIILIHLLFRVYWHLLELWTKNIK